MTAETLPPTAQSAYADLLAALLAAPMPARGTSWFKREVKGRPYWYLQYALGNSKRSVYVGPDDARTRRLVERAQQITAGDADARVERERLAGTFVAAGGYAPPLAEARVYEAITQAGVFEVGGVLVGTHAFLNLGNQLGVRWRSSDRTEDIDVAHDAAIAVAAPNDPVDLPAALQASGRGVLPVPALDPRHPSTSFKIRGEPLTVSLLTPERGKPSEGPVRIAALNATAEPLRYLDYLIEDSQLAAVPAAAGLLVRVPAPGRFALHKLVVSQRRPPAFATKSRKDLAQAAAVVSVLAALRPDDLTEARRAAEQVGGKFIHQLDTAIGLLDAQTQDALRP